MLKQSSILDSNSVPDVYQNYQSHKLEEQEILCTKKLSENGSAYFVLPGDKVIL